MARLRQALALAPLALLSACMTRPPYLQPTLALADGWAGAAHSQASPTAVEVEGWWTALGDPAIDALIEAGLRDNPTLLEAAARVDQARASLAIDRAATRPRVDLAAGASSSRDASANSKTADQASLTAGPSLAWELDFWGRVQETASAAQSRLDARTAEAREARLSITSQIADATLRLRACDQTLVIRNRDIGSRDTELSISRQRLSLGAATPATVAAVEGDLALARTDRLAQQEACARLLNALVALSGETAPEVRRHLPAPERIGELAALAPSPTPFVPDLPATVLLAHPRVVAAEREVAARWSEIAVARAEQLPRVDLAAALSGQWLRALGSGGAHGIGSLGLGLALPLFDSGAGTARIDGARARYREAVAVLDYTVRIAARDIEDGLAGQQSAIGRQDTAHQAMAAARLTFEANEARWRAGALSRFDLEDSRRRLLRAEENAVVASCDRARAWVELVRLAGPGAGMSAAGGSLAR
jgi:multidrug efflux system outer membrane protein